MENGPYYIAFDKTGFPLVKKSGWHFFISLFPVSKYQFERFMSQCGPMGNFYTDYWYRNILSVNPRCSWRNVSRPWELFLTGLSIDEINPFFQYLGEGSRLPSAEEWLTFLECSDELAGLTDAFLDTLSKEHCPEPVLYWIKEGLHPLMKEGLLEWVEDSGKKRCIGHPFTAFYPNLWQPDSIRDIDMLSPLRKVVGFRVVKDG